MIMNVNFTNENTATLTRPNAIVLQAKRIGSNPSLPTKESERG